MGILLALASQLCTAFLLTLVVAALLPTGHHGSIVDWLRGAVTLSGYAQRAAVTADYSFISVGGTGSLSLVGPSLVLLLLVFGTIAAWVVMAERRRPSVDSAQAVIRTVVGAAAYGLAWAALALLSRGELGWGLADSSTLHPYTHVSVNVGTWSAAWHTFLAALGVGAAARLPRLLRASPVLAAGVRKWMASTVASLLVAASGAALAVLTGIGWVVHTAVTSGGIPGVTSELAALAEKVTYGDVRSGTGAVVLLSIHAINALTIGAGVVVGDALGYSVTRVNLGTQSGFSQSSDHVGVLLNSGSPWWLVILLAAWLLAAVIGLRAGTRGPVDASGALLRLGRYLATSVALWTLLVGLTTISYHSRLDGPIAGRMQQNSSHATYGVRAGLGWLSSLLIALVLGTLLYAGDRWLLPAFAAGAPKLTATLAGRRMDPAWALRLAEGTIRSGRRPQPWLAALAHRSAGLAVRPLVLDRRRLRLVLGATGAALVLVSGAGFLHHWLSGTVYGPGPTATAYVEALQAGRSADALALLRDPPHAVTLTDRALQAGNRLAPISGVQFESSTVSGDSATATIRYHQGDTEVRRAFALRADSRHSHLLGLFSGWVITSGGLGEVDISPDDLQGAVTVAGQPVVVDDETDLPVFPTLFAVTAAGSSVIQNTSIPVDLRGDDAEPAVVEMPVFLRPAVDAAATEAVTEQLAACIKSRSLAPEGCPFAEDFPNGDTQRDIRWKLSRPAQAIASLTDDGGVIVDGSAHLTVSYIQKSAHSRSGFAEQEVTADLAGYATWNGRVAAVTFDYANDLGD